MSLILIQKIQENYITEMLGRIEKFDVSRSIASKAKNRVKAKEVIIKNY